jgi:Ca-activated chloride channel homolog
MGDFSGDQEKGKGRCLTMPAVYNIILSLMVICLAASPAMASRAAGEANKANALYRKGKFADALQHYEKALDKDPRSAAVEYGLGTAFYKRGNYAAAIEHLNKTLLTDDVKLQNSARYNLGNALYKSGIKQEKSNVDGAIAALEKSLVQYEKVIAAEPGDADARFNHEFVKKQLERLKQKKEDQKNNKDQQGQQDKKDQKDQKDKQGQQDQRQDQKDQSSDGKQDQSEQDKGQGQKDQKDPSQDQQSKNDEEGDKDQKQDGGQEPKDKEQDQDKGKPEPNDPQSPPEKEQGEGDSGGEEGMTPKEANMVLGDYERNEEPKGMLYFVPQPSKENPVVKDW